MRRRFFLMDKRGFSVSELLVATFIVALILGAAVSLEISFNRSFFVSVGYLELHSGVRNAVDALTRDARWTGSVVSSQGGYTTGNSVVVMQIPALDTSGNVKLTSTGAISAYDYIVYRVVNADLQRITIADGTSSRASQTRTIAKNITTLSFGSVDATTGTITALGSISSAALVNVSTLSVTITVSKSVVSLGGAPRTIQESINEQIRFRNK